MLDYYVVLLEDCLGAYDDVLHRAALQVMASRYDVVDSGAVLDAWLKAGARRQAGLPDDRSQNGA